MRPYRLFLQGWLIVGGLCAAVPAFADHTIWFNPLDAKLDGATLGTPLSPQSLRVWNVFGEPRSATLTIPLSVRSDIVIDSVIVCYQAQPNQYGPDVVSGITLRTMSVPATPVTLLDAATAFQSTIGECAAVDVADLVPIGAPELILSFSLNPGGKVDIGAVGLRLKGPASLGLEGPIDVHEPSLAISPNQPDPFTPPTRIEFAIATPQHVRVQVFDVAGRAARTLVDRMLPPGRYAETWDGRDDAGRRLTPGVYYARLAGNGAALSERMVMLR